MSEGVGDMNVKHNLAKIRKEKGISQGELATLCNVTTKMLKAWEKGKREPDANQLDLLARALHVQADTLLVTQVSNDALLSAHKYYNWTKEYTSSITIFAIPLVHVDLGLGRRKDGKRHLAKGIIAIGNSAIGVIAIGAMSAGVVSIGLLSLGLCFAIGLLSISYLALGLFAIGYISIGVLAIGEYSVGSLSIGYQLGIGTLVYGNDVIGVTAFGNHVYLIQRQTACMIHPSDYQDLQTLIQQGELPVLISFLLKHIPLCP